MPEPCTDRTISRAQGFLRGLGELAAFIAAAASAVFQFCIGRFPEFPQRAREQKHRDRAVLLEKIAPFPTND